VSEVVAVVATVLQEMPQEAVVVALVIRIIYLLPQEQVTLLLLVPKELAEIQVAVVPHQELTVILLMLLL
jgi:hypothetical protein